MTLPETLHHRGEEEEEDSQAAMSDDDIFGPARTILRRTKTKISMISNEFRLKEKRKRIIQLCLRKLERIKDSENNLRRSVCIHNTFSKLSSQIKQEKQIRNQQQQQQCYKEPQQRNQKAPKEKKAEKLDLENLEELCSIDEFNDSPIHDPILKNSEEIEQALSRKRKAEVEKALLSYHQLEKRLKSDISNSISIVDAFRDEGLAMQCNNNNLLNPCSKAVLDSSSMFQAHMCVKSLET